MKNISVCPFGRCTCICTLNNFSIIDCSVNFISKKQLLGDDNWWSCFQPGFLSHLTILPPHLFIELLLRHVQHLLHLAPIVVLLIEEQRSPPVVGLQIHKCLENPEDATSVKEVFDVIPLALS